MNETPAVRTRQTRHLQPDTPQTLEELSTTINREHELCEQDIRSALRHALAAGDALLAARSQVPPGEWMRWLTTNFTASARTANYYIRLTSHRNLLTPDLTLNQAQAAIRGLPGPVLPGAPPQYDKAIREEAVRLVRDDNLSVRETARRLGVPATTVDRWVNPKAVRERKRNEHNRRVAAANALALVQRNTAIKKAVRKAGAGLAEMYAMSERMQGVLAQAIKEAEDVEAREALECAGEYYRKMRDEVVKALGVS